MQQLLHFHPSPGGRLRSTHLWCHHTLHNSPQTPLKPSAHSIVGNQQSTATAEGAPRRENGRWISGAPGNQGIWCKETCQGTESTRAKPALRPSRSFVMSRPTSLALRPSVLPRTIPRTERFPASFFSSDTGDLCPPPLPRIPAPSLHPLQWHQGLHDSRRPAAHRVGGGGDPPPLCRVSPK